MEKKERKEAAPLEDWLLEDVTGGTASAVTQKTTQGKKANALSGSLNTAAEGQNPTQQAIEHLIETTVETAVQNGTGKQKSVTTKTITTVKTTTTAAPGWNQ